MVLFLVVIRPGFCAERSYLHYLCISKLGPPFSTPLNVERPVLKILPPLFLSIFKHLLLSFTLTPYPLLLVRAAFSPLSLYYRYLLSPPYLYGLHSILAYPLSCIRVYICLAPVVAAIEEEETI